MKTIFDLREKQDGEIYEAIQGPGKNYWTNGKGHGNSL